MTSGYRTWSLAMAAALCLPSLLWAAERVGRSKLAAEKVEMFAAMEAGQIDVKLIPKDSKQSKLLIENKTDRPLSVQLPEAFAGVQVLAQFGGGGGGLGGGGGGLGGGGGGFGGGGGGGQSLGGGGGGGLGGGGGGFGGGGGLGGGGGAFNIPPEKVGKITVTTVCLEHGKAEPRPRMKYEIKPIEEVTDKPEVRELCRMLGQGMMSQRVAQVAAWHLSSGLSWQQLAAKQIIRGNGFLRRPYFTRQEIQAGMQAAAMAVKLAQQRETPGKSDSLSQN